MLNHEGKKRNDSFEPLPKLYLLTLSLFASRASFKGRDNSFSFFFGGGASVEGFAWTARAFLQRQLMPTKVSPWAALIRGM